MPTEIRRASKRDIPFLCEIWKACFCDTEEYIKYFYEENFSRIEVLVFCVDNKPVSMVNMLEASYESGEKSQGARLIYATGTLPEHRSRGYMGELIKHACKNAKQGGYAIFLKPSKPSLVEYYSKFGFEVDSYFSVVNFEPCEKQGCEFSEISYKEYNKMRNSAFSEIPYVKWSDEHLDWCDKENAFFGGKTLSVTLDGAEYFLMAYPEEKTLVITETNLSLSLLKQISGDLCQTFETEIIKAYMPCNSDKAGERIISSVAYNTQVCNTYVNLILI